MTPQKPAGSNPDPVPKQNEPKTTTTSIFPSPSRILGPQKRSFYDYLHCVGMNRRLKKTHLERFVLLKTHVDRVNFAYATHKIYKWFSMFEEPSKRTSQSRTMFKKGNALLKKEMYLDSLKSYTLSAAHAETEHNLAYAYERRALCLQKMGLYAAMIVDCQRALAHNHPEPDLLLQRIESARALAKPRDFNYHEPVPFIPEDLKHPRLQSARNCLEIVPIISEDISGGWHVEATEELQIGEVVAVERPYVSVNVETYCHCHYCQEQCFNLIPCLKCPIALYCSEICRDDAYQKYHQYDCVVLPQLEAMGLPRKRYLAIRTALVARNELELYDETKLREKEYRSDRLEEILNLISNNLSHNLLADEFFRTSAIVAYVYRLLKRHTKFFEGLDESVENTFKDVLMRLFFLCDCSITEILELSGTQAGRKKVPNLLGYGFNPFHSLLPHSCAPNLLRVSYGNYAVLYVVSPVRPGQKLSVSYGPIYTAHSKPKRVAHLIREYGNTCNCLACKNEWKQIDLSSGSPGIPDRFKYLLRTLGHNFEPTLARTIIEEVKEKRKERSLTPEMYAFLYHLTTICVSVFGNKHHVVFETSE